MFVSIRTAKFQLFIGLLIGLLLLQGCYNTVWERSAFAPCRFRIQSSDCWQAPQIAQRDADLIAVAYAASDNLLNSLFKTLHREEAIIISTLVDLDQLHSSSSLGRLLSEHMAARFTQQGYTVLEARLQKELLYQEQEGEFILSRVVHQLRKTHPVANLVLGTYSIAEDTIYLNVKLVNQHSVTLASHSFILPLGKNTQHLLQH